MKLLMVLRDPLPARCVDVAVLFDRELRALGVATDFAGSPAAADAAGAACQGRVHGLPHRTHPLAWWAEMRAAWRLLPDYDLLMVRDKPISVAWLYPMAALRRRPVAYWMSFPIPLGDRIAAAMHRRHGRWLRAAAVGARGWLGEQVLRHYGLRRADGVFVQSAAMRQQLLESQPRLDPRRVSAVPMGVDPAALPASTDQLLPGEELPAPGPWIVYVGSLEFSRQLGVLIDALAQVRRHQPTARLVLIGGAHREQDVQQLREHAAARGLGEAVHFTGRLPMRQALRIASAASVAVSPIPPGPLFDVSSPTKIVEYLALGLPVVATAIPDQQDLLARLGGGLCVAFDAVAIAEAVLVLLADPDAARQAARSAGAAVLEERAYPVLARQVHATLLTLLGAQAIAPGDQLPAPLS